MAENTPYSGTIHPPVSDKISEMAAATGAVKMKKIAATLAAAVFICGIFWVAGWLLEWNWLKITGYLLTGLFLIYGVVSALTAKVTSCPYCGAKLGATAGTDLSASDTDHRIECDHCFEWLVSHKGQVRAFTEQDSGELKEIEAPVFEGSVWPDECIICGAPPTHVEKAVQTKVELGKLLVGTLSVAAGSVSNLPYCDQHSGAVSLSIEGDQLRLVFPDLGARRRYLHVNKGKKPARVRD
jgi:hypothetical protein